LKRFWKIADSIIFYVNMPMWLIITSLSRLLCKIVRESASWLDIYVFFRNLVLGE